MAIYLILLLLLGLGTAALLGRTPDSRDPDYDLGLVAAPDDRQAGLAHR
jgi:hypothetical protein